MSHEKNITRREALKKMGTVAAGIGLGIGGVHAADAPGLSGKEEKRGKGKVLAINGSSRKDGNTADMLNLVLGGSWKRRVMRRSIYSWQAIPSIPAKLVSDVPERKIVCPVMTSFRNFTER